MCILSLLTLLCVLGVKVAYLIDKSPLEGEHAFPLKEIVGWMAHVIILFVHNSRSIKSMLFSDNNIQV